MDEFRLLWDESSASKPKAYASVVVAPPVTTSSRNNPAFRAYVYNRETAALQDWIGYLLAMQKANYHGFRPDAPTAYWKEFYSLRRTFGIPNASTQSLAAVYGRLQTSEPMLSAYLDHAYGHFIGEKDYMGYLCDIRYVHKRTNSECKRLGREVPVVSHAPGEEPRLVSDGAGGIADAGDGRSGG